MSTHRAHIGGSARTKCRPAHRIAPSRSRWSERSSVKAAAGLRRAVRGSQGRTPHSDGVTRDGHVPGQDACLRLLVRHRDRRRRAERASSGRRQESLRQRTWHPTPLVGPCPLLCGGLFAHDDRWSGGPESLVAVGIPPRSFAIVATMSEDL